MSFKDEVSYDKTLFLKMPRKTPPDGGVFQNTHK